MTKKKFEKRALNTVLGSKFILNLQYCAPNSNLTTIGGPWYFDRASVPQRLINQSLYHEILLLQKFNDLLGKVLKPKKIVEAVQGIALSSSSG